MNNLGKPLIIMGLILLAVGLLVSFSPKFPTWLGRLPGDISFRREQLQFLLSPRHLPAALTPPVVHHVAVQER